MAESTVLNLILWLPVLGMVGLLLAPQGTDRAVRGFTLFWIAVNAPATTSGPRKAVSATSSTFRPSRPMW